MSSKLSKEETAKMVEKLRKLEEETASGMVEAYERMQAL